MPGRDQEMVFAYRVLRFQTDDAQSSKLRRTESKTSSRLAPISTVLAHFGEGVHDGMTYQAIADEFGWGDRKTAQVYDKTFVNRDSQRRFADAFLFAGMTYRAIADEFGWHNETARCYDRALSNRDWKWADAFLFAGMSADRAIADSTTITVK